MFSIILYYCNTENNRMDKTEYLQKIASIQGNLREQTSIINPSITIELNDQIIKGLIEHKDILVDDNEIPVKTNDYFPIVIKYRKKVLSANYLWIPQFDRYYFIDDIISVTNTLWRIDCSVDVLMSFKKDILNLDVYASRNEFNYDEFIPDSKVPSTCKVNTFTKTSDTIFSLDRDFYSLNVCIILGGQSDLPFESYGYDFPDFTTSMNKCLITNFYTLQKFIQELLAIGHSGATSIFGSDLGQSIQSISVIPLSPLNQYFSNQSLVTTIYGENNVVDHYEATVSFLGNTIKMRSARLTNDGKPALDIREITDTYGSIADFICYINMSEYVPNNFTKYSKYSDAQLYIPFYGYLNVESEIFDSLIEIHYIMSLSHNTVTIEISSENYGLLYILNDNIFGSELPITYTDKNERKRNILSGIIQIGAGVAGAAFTGGASLGLVSTGTGSMIKPATTKTKINRGKDRKITSVTKTVTPAEYEETKSFNPDKLLNYISDCTIDMMSSFVKKNYGGGGSTSGSAWFINDAFKVKGVFRKMDYYYPEGYNHLVGRPSRYVGKLSGLYGYTEIAGVHIENIKIATSDERTAIEEELKTGVILPNQSSSSGGSSGGSADF